MKTYSIRDWADLENPTQEEYHLWLTADPSRGLALIATVRDFYAKKKGTMTPEKRREIRALNLQLRQETAHFMIRHIISGIITRVQPYAEGRTTVVPRASQIQTHLRRLALARKYLPHLPPAKRKGFRASITRVSGLLRKVRRIVPASQPIPRRSRSTSLRPRRTPPA